VTFSDRILKGRLAKDRLEDNILNEAFDFAVEKWMRAIISAAPAEDSEILEAKRRIDAIQEVRRTIKSWVDDGQLAQVQQEEEEKYDG
jgi:predicted RNA polymerase sigma factor